MNDSRLEDDALIEAFLSTGDRASLADLTARHLPRVRSVVRSMLLQDAEADDVTQEIFLKVLRGLKDFQGRSRFDTWLYRIAMNTVHSHLRSRSRTPVSLLPCLQEIRSAAPQADAGMHREEVFGAVEAALEDLSPPLRGAIVLVCLEGRDPKEVAEIENCSVGTIYWRLHEARKRLSLRLGEYLE